MRTLLQIFQDTKEVLCRYDYYIHTQKRILYHCNSFMTTYQNDRDRDSFFRDLPYRYEITRIIRENKDTKHKEVIYQSVQAEEREQAGIEKMLAAAGIRADGKLIKPILRLNKKFGIYHTADMLNDSESLRGKCTDKRGENLVADFLALWEGKEDGI